MKVRVGNSVGNSGQRCAAPDGTIGVAVHGDGGDVGVGV